MFPNPDINPDSGLDRSKQNGDPDASGESIAGAPGVAKDYARAARLAAIEISYIDNPDFAAEEIRADFLAEFAQPGDSTGSVAKGNGGARGKGDLLYVDDLYKFGFEVFSRDQEEHEFRKYNYLKHLASRDRDALDPLNPDPVLMDRMESRLAQSQIVRNRIIEANLRLVVSIVSNLPQRDGDFEELVDRGNDSLMRAVEKFDYARGNKFSTYASWAISNNAGRDFYKDLSRRSRFQQNEFALDSAPSSKDEDYHLDMRRYEMLRAVVPELLAVLDEREGAVLKARFGLDEEERTLEELGREYRITKERIRQIQNRALKKIKAAVLTGEISAETAEILGEL